MPPIESFTVEQVNALAPDAASLKAAQGVAAPRKWSGLGRTESALWGDCQGSGSTPYLVQIDLTEPTFKCSCPSRKFPCKHALGLLLLAVNQPDAVPSSEPPSRVAGWIASRAARVEQAVQRAETLPDPAAQAKRAAQRQQKVLDGVQQLDLWLRDLVRGGIAAVQGRGYRYWEGMAARMVDAQAPGIARQLREMAGIPASGPGWPERLLERISLLHLLVEAYQRLDALPEPAQGDVRAAVGFSIRQEDLLAQPGQRDRWIVLGRRLEDQDQLRVQRTWLWGGESRQPALILDFAVRGQSLDTSLIPGLVFDGELVFYPSASPLRAVVKRQRAAGVFQGDLPGYHSPDEALSAFAQAIARNPWLDEYPLLLNRVLPLPAEPAMLLISPNGGSALPISAGFTGQWQLLALSGGHPLALAGEWNGASFLPLAAWPEGRYVSL